MVSMTIIIIIIAGKLSSYLKKYIDQFTFVHLQLVSQPP